MPTVKAGGLQNGASPITSGNGTLQGIIESREGSSSAPGILKLYDSTGVAFFLNIGSAGVVRAGQNDPTADPDLNESLVALSGGLDVGGANWMTGRFMTADLRISSRVGILTDIGDDFDGGTLDSSLWSTSGTPTVGSGHLILNANGEGIKSKNELVDDFDIRAFFAFASFTSSLSALVMGVAMSALRKSESPAITIYGDLIEINVRSPTHVLTNIEVAGSINGVGATADSNVTGGLSASGWAFAVRITRVGNTWNLYYRVQPGGVGDYALSSNLGWTLLQTGSYTPTAGINGQVRFGAQATLTGYVETFSLYSGSPAPATAPTGPAFKLDSLAALAAANTFVQIFNGPSTIAANEISRLTTDAEWIAGLVGTTQGTLAPASAGTNAPGLLRFYEDDDSSLLVLWAEAGGLRAHTAAPSASTDGRFIGPTEYGGISLIGGSAAQTTNATPGTYDKITAFGGGAGAEMAVSYGTTPSAANSQITVTHAGIWLVHYRIGATADLSTDYTVGIAIGGTVQDVGKDNTDNTSAGHQVHFTGTALYSLSAGAVLDLRVAADAGSKSFEVNHACFVVQRIG